MSLPAENPAATWQLQTFDPSAIGVPVPTPLPTEGAAETGQLAPTPTGSAATAGPAWTFPELSHAKWEITQRRAVAMAWKLGLTGKARQLSISDPMTLFDDHVAKCATKGQLVTPKHQIQVQRDDLEAGRPNTRVIPSKRLKLAT